MPRVPTHTDVEFIRLPGLPGVELRRSSYRDSVFRSHTHPEWSVGLIESGSTTFALQGRSYRAAAGHMVVIPPGRTHACNPSDGDSISYLMFYLSREWLASGEPEAGFPTFAGPVINDHQLFERWSAVYRQFTSHPDRPERALLEAALDDLVTRHAEPGGTIVSARERTGVANAKRLMNERLDQRVTLDELAAEAAMSRSHLSRAFTAAEGLPPHAYHNQLRVERAKELLVAGAPLARAATAAGFADQSHFSRVFREYTGATPSQYQAAGSGRA